MASIVKSLRILGDTNRLRMVLLLAREELSVAELQEILGMGQSTISTHLAQLKHAGLVEDRRTGKGFDLAMTASVNGTTYSTGNLVDLHWSFEQMISFASRGTELRTGDVIGSGTVGTGCILELSGTHGPDAYPWLQLTPVTSDDPAFDGMQGNVGRVAARYMPHRECEAYVAGPADMVRETIRVLRRAGIPGERIHYDDALLAARPRVGSGT